METINKDEFNSDYCGKTLEERQETGAFFTPPELLEKMFGKLEDENIVGKTILDPTCGDGNILVYALHKKVNQGQPVLEALNDIYGIELDVDYFNKCKTRLVEEYEKLCKLKNETVDIDTANEIVGWHIYNGDALDSNSYMFEMRDPKNAMSKVTFQFGM